MTIPADILQKWKLLQCYGDITKMADGSEVKRVYLSNAMNTGRCTDGTFIILRDFYAKREQLIDTAKRPVCFQPN